MCVNMAHDPTLPMVPYCWQAFPPFLLTAGTRKLYVYCLIKGYTFADLSQLG